MEGASFLDSSSDDEECVWEAIRQVECGLNKASSDPVASLPGPRAPGVGACSAGPLAPEVGACSGFKRQKSCGDFTKLLENPEKKARMDEYKEQHAARSTCSSGKKTKLEEYKERQFHNFLEGYTALAAQQQPTGSASSMSGKRAPFKEFLQSRQPVREMRGTHSGMGGGQ